MTHYEKSAKRNVANLFEYKLERLDTNAAGFIKVLRDADDLNEEHMDNINFTTSPDESLNMKLANRFNHALTTLKMVRPTALHGLVPQRYPKNVPMVLMSGSMDTLKFIYDSTTTKKVTQSTPVMIHTRQPQVEQSEESIWDELSRYIPPVPNSPDFYGSGIVTASTSTTTSINDYGGSGDDSSSSSDGSVFDDNSSYSSGDEYSSNTVSSNSNITMSPRPVPLTTASEIMPTDPFIQSLLSSSPPLPQLLPPLSQLPPATLLSQSNFSIEIGLLLPKKMSISSNKSTLKRVDTLLKRTMPHIDASTVSKKSMFNAIHRINEMPGIGYPGATSLTSPSSPLSSSSSLLTPSCTEEDYESIIPKHGDRVRFVLDSQPTVVWYGTVMDIVLRMGSRFKYSRNVFITVGSLYSM